MTQRPADLHLHSVRSAPTVTGERGRYLAGADLRIMSPCISEVSIGPRDRARRGARDRVSTKETAMDDFKRGSLLVAALVLGTALATTGCEQRNSSETVGQKVDRAADKIAAKTDAAADKMAAK